MSGADGVVQSSKPSTVFGIDLGPCDEQLLDYVGTPLLRSKVENHSIVNHSIHSH